MNAMESLGQRASMRSPSAPGAAAVHATDRVPRARPEQTVGEVRRNLAGQRFDAAGVVAVLDRGAFVGLLPLERLFAADARARVLDIADRDPPVASPAMDEEHAARLMVERGGVSVAVVDEAGRFRGIVPPDRMLAVLAAEHEEDLARLGGFLAGAARARGAAQESISRRLWHRLPWLALGLVGAMGAAIVVAGFEDRLSANILLAFFIPAVVYMADAVGTQTETVLIRALSVGVSVRAMLMRELASGLIMGVLIGGAFLGFALIGWGDLQVAVAVGVALLASCSLATMVAMTLPSIFQRLGRDPAFGSGPLATVVQDLLSIAVYLAVVSVVVA